MKVVFQNLVLVQRQRLTSKLRHPSTDIDEGLQLCRQSSTRLVFIHRQSPAGREAKAKQARDGLAAFMTVSVVPRLAEDRDLAEPPGLGVRHEQHLDGMPAPG
jgi:hypothetical protein